MHQFASDFVFTIAIALCERCLRRVILSHTMTCPHRQQFYHPAWHDLPCTTCSQFVCVPCNVSPQHLGCIYTEREKQFSFFKTVPPFSWYFQLQVKFGATGNVTWSVILRSPRLTRLNLPITNRTLSNVRTDAKTMSLSLSHSFSVNSPWFYIHFI